MGEFKDLAVEGAAIFAMPEEMRHCIIVEPEPRYIEIPSLDDPTKIKEKLVMQVKLSNGASAEYYPNKTSARVIANHCGTDMKEWIGKTITWGRIMDQVVGGVDKKVLYITEVK